MISGQEQRTKGAGTGTQDAQRFAGRPNLNQVGSKQGASAQPESQIPDLKSPQKRTK